MSVKFYLRQNAIQQNDESFKAVVIPNKVCDLKAIISQMVLSGTTLSEADIIASLHLFFDVVTQEVQDGNHVNLPIVHFRPTISGKFTGAFDSFDAARHKIKASASTGVSLNKMLKNSKTEKVNKALTIPILGAFKDIVSGTVNDILSPGGIGEVVGNHLKFNPNNPAEGLFLMSSSKEYFPISTLATIHPKKLLFSIPPDLEQGRYTLIVRKAFGKTAATVRQGGLPTLLKIL